MGYIGLGPKQNRLDGPATEWIEELTRFVVVRLGDDLYVRSVYGRTGAWFRGTQVRHEGHIWAGGVDKDVTLFRNISTAKRLSGWSTSATNSTRVTE
jgi:hypothetical protein